MTQNFTLKQGTHNINGVSWITPGARANIFLLHGIGEYANRYDTTARFFNDMGFNVYSFDFLGHGHSSGSRGHIGNRQSVLSLVDNLINYANTQNDLPAFIFAHSMGANIALTYRFFMTNSKVKAYILSAPWLKLQRKLPFLKIFLAKTTSLFVPTAKFDFGTSKNIKENLAEDFIRDDLIHSFISSSTFFMCEKNAKIILNTYKVPGPPMMIFAGDIDKICNSNVTADFANKTNSIFINIKDSGHELMHKGEYINILERATSFINDNLGD